MSTGLRFTLEVDGLPPDAFAVVSFHLNQSLSSLFSLDLSLVSQQFLSLEFQQILDKMAYLTIWQGDDVQRRVKGMVTWFELGENDKNQMLYSMKVCPPLWRTGLRQNFRIFQNEDIESILGTILQENGVTEWSPLFSEPHPSREFCVQYGETDYDFLCRMAAEEGIFFYEEHAQKSTDQSLVLCDTVRYLPESFEIPWNPNTRTEVSTLCISQFRYSAQNQVEKVGIIRALTVGVAYQTTVGGIMNTSVALLQSSQVGLHKSLMVGMGYSVNVGNNVTFSVGKTMKENTGQTAVYSAGEHLELCCGKARLVLTKDGSIFLNGTHIHLEGESDVNGDSPVINWNCGATQPVPDAPVPKDLPPGMPDMRQF
ncbi:TPA: type VI secretion system tip protein VgrG [Escherichia coli]|uniref:type VI secretion system tip protein TssI/VgrG n=1 Tax=Escherichia coli TaxID=562 RepID=UPI000FB1DE83|nr:type VI secretion system tip protein VgrG [Escherichia coli]EGF4700149.1 type VI secretion system tip protein VgrG [Escherichia coli]MKZ60782.1 type VI secretion system tip protein VgrG [Escherichia coli]HAV7555633.1 type VI secretion system tip protein VgrG [Escherichia coli]HAV9019940.1 type VI secretion system tip protein VgrG [Escherichia coli]